MNQFIYLVSHLVLTVSIVQGAGLHANEHWRQFQYDDLLRQRADLHRPYLRFLLEASMSMGLYELPAGGEDDQTPHKLDEVYYIMQGRATLVVADDEVAVKPGSIIYVKTQVPHQFKQIKEALQVLVIFSKTEHDPEDPDWLAFDLQDVRAARKKNENVWDAFLEVATLRFGLYMLPKALAGDQTLRHQVDEVNLVIAGSGKFSIGDDEIDVKPGSIVWVKAGTGHSFHDLSDDLDVLILFERRREKN